jgi:hypothetical protein
MFGANFSRSDVHPAALVETDEPIMECATCGLPVPMEANGDIYCDKACENTALEEALWEDAIEEAVRKHKDTGPDIFAQMFPSVVAMPEPECPTLVECSCMDCA